MRNGDKDQAKVLAIALNPGLILEAQGLTPDPWQKAFLESTSKRIMLNCCRGAGKSRSTSAKALHTALTHPGSLVLLISKAQRQAGELYRYVKQAYHAVGSPYGLRKETETQLEINNGSRIVSLPGKESTIRSFQNVRLLVIDEAARVAEDLYASVSPMTAISDGTQILLSTPFMQRGFFWKEWHSERAWEKFKITWRECPRYHEDFIDEERFKFGSNWVSQEYECSFVSMSGLVYPDHERGFVVLDDCPRTDEGQHVGGIDFGWRNPFAAVWGILDRDDVLWIVGERYLSQTPLHEHREALKAKGSITWYADPAGRTETEELRVAGLVVRRGDNDIRAGIAAVTARLSTGRLKVCPQTCPNLAREFKAYRYPNADEKAVVGENPVDQDNHALAALRYLISRLDARFIARIRKRKAEVGTEEAEREAQQEQERANKRKEEPWLRYDNDQLWK